MKFLIKNLLIVTLLSGSFVAISQESRFYMPTEIQKAYKNETRSFNGKPGAKYWQNTADYKMEVSIDPLQKTIDGKSVAIYYNNSPKPISNLVIRLYYDIYKKGATRRASVKAEDVSDDGVEISELKLNGETINLNDRQSVRRSGSNLSYRLKTPLKSGEKITMNINWKQKIPLTDNRSGVYDSTAFFIGQWYPQFAVYDDIFGWDMLPFNMMTEFYNNLANFDVEIKVPADYVVWATGTFQNVDKVLPAENLKRYKKALDSEEPVAIIDGSDLQNGFKTNDSTWHFTAKEVSDFAFGVSNHYQWTAGKVTLGDRKVLVSSAFPTEKASDYQGHTAMQQKAMKHFSNDFPGVPYPYEAFTSFIGLHGGGMEYPMMANNDGPDEGVAIHEMYHTYFPMYVRTNEKLWAWMDEGWATKVTSVIEQRYFKNQPEITAQFSEFREGMDGTMGSVYDLPLITPSESQTNYNYYYASYPLSANVYTILHHHLGDALFLKCYQEYIRRWAKKSPTPYDFFYTFENVSGQDLGWLWKPWFFEFGVPDLAIKSFKNNKLTIENKGQKPVPVFVKVEYNDSTTKTIEKSAKVWADGTKTIVVDIPNYKNISNLVVNKDVADINLSDNLFPSLAERYKKMAISDKIYGTYQMNWFQGTFEMVDGVAHFIVDQFELNEELYPTGKTTLKSLDDKKTFNFQFDEKGGCKGIEIEWYGYKFDAQKL